MEKDRFYPLESGQTSQSSAVVFGLSFQEQMGKSWKAEELGGPSAWDGKPIQRAQDKDVWQWSLG